jgi:hypothetical protein
MAPSPPKDPKSPPAETLIPAEKARVSVERGVHQARQKIEFLIAAKAGKSPAQLTDYDTSEFVSDFVAFCNKEKIAIQKRDVRRWIAKKDSIIYGRNKLRVIDYFRAHLPYITDSMLDLDLRSFKERLAASFRASRVLTVEAPIELGTFDAEDVEFLCGVYELYRYSFANNGEISVDLLVITPDQSTSTHLKLELIVRPMTPDRPYERFCGLIYNYGQSLFAVATLKTRNPKLALIRCIEFPIDDAIRMREHMVKIGIMSGSSGQLRGPVSAKCLASKVSDAHRPLPAYLRLVQRYSRDQLHQPYVEAISNDIRGDRGFLLSIGATKKPSPRRRHTYPPLPNDPNDPDKVPSE